MPRQYAACRFRPYDKRSYTYHNDGEPLAIGDFATVETKDGKVQVEVVTIVDEPPPFETKPIIGKVEKADADSSEEGSE